MINDFHIGGVFVPGLLVIALVALTCTLLLVSFFSFGKGYRRLPFRPMIDFSICIMTFYLLLQGLTELGLFA
ncbi:DUF1656 domain-containing protein [Martelella alba]|uniref:DUF1656 domain-containing protein n=1 Tax=Martelella alba TaxID=2590451 RepID=A0ABY2SPI3_9HYPH|nr:DUF1656 domain-containing protein [Martelella alba]TKI07912.1 DUF1656 domain-containing protein [Martelella alba]